jgi:hypothetical protein
MCIRILNNHVFILSYTIKTICNLGKALPAESSLNILLSKTLRKPNIINVL